MPLSHLTPEQLDELIGHYYDGTEPIARLLEAFALRVSPGRLAALFPPEVRVDRPCPHCARPLEQHWPTRAQFARRTLPPLACPRCGHQDVAECACPGCVMRHAQAHREQVRQLLAASRAAADSAAPVALEGLSLREAVSLLALVRSGLTEDYAGVLPLAEQPVALAPTRGHAHAILRQLTERGLLALHPDAPPEAFYREPDGTLSYDPDLIAWQVLPGHSPEQARAFIDALTARVTGTAWPEHWRAEVTPLWREIALHECLAYLAVGLADHGMALVAGEKTRQGFEAILAHHSIAQTYNFIWSGVRNAASYYLQHGGSRRHAANTVVGYCQRRAERARAEGWVTIPYRRDYRCPVSGVAALLANAVLRVGEARYLELLPTELPAEGGALTGLSPNAEHCP